MIIVVRGERRPPGGHPWTVEPEGLTPISLYHSLLTLAVCREPRNHSGAVSQNVDMPVALRVDAHYRYGMAGQLANLLGPGGIVLEL